MNFKCPNCERWFVDKSALEQHLVADLRRQRHPAVHLVTSEIGPLLLHVADVDSRGVQIMASTDTREPKPAIEYIRVSSQKQGQSGLGLEAQREAVNRFCAAERFNIVASFIEVQTAKGDTLDCRPKLKAALKAARKIRDADYKYAPIIVAGEQLFELAFALFERRRPQVLAVSSIKSNPYRKTCESCAPECSLSKSGATGPLAAAGGTGGGTRDHGSAKQPAPAQPYLRRRWLLTPTRELLFF
jgi:Resolvase, N terminal domain